MVPSQRSLVITSVIRLKRNRTSSRLRSSDQSNTPLILHPASGLLFFYIRMHIFNAQAEYSYFSADFRLKIFFGIFLDYTVLYFIRIADMSPCVSFYHIESQFCQKKDRIFKTFRG